MRKSTRGAVATAAAALLLLGGWGTHATWSDDGTVEGTDIATGHLKLVNADCAGWLINGSLFDPTSVKIVPGSVLTQVCTFEVDALGVDLKANLSVTAPSFSSTNGLTTALQTSATYTNADDDSISATTDLNDGDVVTAAITVTLPRTIGNAVQDLSATLDSITVTATQA